MRNVSAILVSDTHIRETQPECRLDSFIDTQTRKLQWLKRLQEKHECPILHGGDFFHHWKPSPWLLAYIFRNLPNGIVITPGQHDLPAHNMKDIEKSGIQVLADAGKIALLTDSNFHIVNEMAISGFPWGVELDSISPLLDYSVAIIHYGVYESKPHYPGAENTGGTALSVIKKMSGFDLILSGDNHLPFELRYKNQLLINPGSFMRTTAAQADHKPSVVLWCAETNEYERVYIPIEKGVISREHIDEVTERDERLESFVSRLDHNIELGISFKTNLRNHLAKNAKLIPKNVVDLIWKSFE
jgi:DNA repair exonuclease SbcCD nuclease subunit